MKNSNEMTRLIQQRKEVVKTLPPLEEIVRGSYLKRYLKCSYPKCKCHKSKKYWHGPFYSISVRKGNKSYHVYVPKKKHKEVKRWVNNYNRLWNGIKKISDINVELMKSGNNK
mgnify:CR=1 FL=1